MRSPPLMLRLSLWVARVASRLAPRGRREQLRSVWEAELTYHWGRGVRGPGAFFLWSFGAFRHAWFLVRREYSMDNVWHDIRHGLRSLNRSRGIMIPAVLTLALGIGASTAVFSVTEAVLIRPLPYPEPDRLVDISHRTKGTNRLSVHRLDVVELGEERSLFESVGGRGMIPDDQSFHVRNGETVHASFLRVTHNYFDVLGVGAALGRTFTRDDAYIRPGPEDEEGNPRFPGVVITHGFWQRAFGGEKDLSRLTLLAGEISLDVLGVLPVDFELLHEQRHRWVKGTSTEVFAPFYEPSFTEAAERGGPGNRGIRALGRLRHGVTYEEAQAAMDVMAARLRAEHPAHENEELRVLVYPLHQDITAWARGAVHVLGGGVLFLMLLVCANIANLQFVRGRIRSGEYAIQAAMGCGRMRLFGQRFWESLALALVGGGIGLALAWGIIRTVGAMAPPNVPLLNHVEMNPTVLIFGFGAALLSMALAGFLPAFHTCRLDPAAILSREGRGTGSEGRRRVMSALVVSGLALSMVLLSGATVMVRSLVSLNRTELGFEPEGIVTFQLDVPRGLEEDRAADMALYRRLEEELAAIPGVEAVARTNGAPLGEDLGNTNYGWSREVLEQQIERGEIIISTPGYLEAMGARLLTGRLFTEEDQYSIGRLFTEEDQHSSTLPVIVDRVLAETAWPGEDPIGRPVFFWRNATEGTVIGVIEPMLQRDFGMTAFEAIHLATPVDYPRMASTWMLRARSGTTGLEASVRRAVRAVDGSLDPWKFRDLGERVSQSKAPFRFIFVLMGVFATVAVVVAVVGLFGVIAYTVRARVGELGIRIALGAEGRNVLGMVLRQAAGLTVVGVAVGAGVALAMGRFMESIVFEVSPTDSGTLLVTALLLAVVSILACAAPARWASRVDPAVALRGE